MQIQMLPLERLTRYARNPRTHSDAQLAQIAASIAEFGFTNPILIQCDGTIIAGHGRLTAQRLGLAEVPVISLNHLTEAQARALVIADNKIAENADWDEELLRAELESLRDDFDYNLYVLGLSDEELAAILDGPEAPAASGAAEGEDELPEAPIDPVSVKGDVWPMESHRLTCGDTTSATDIARVLNGVQAHALANLRRSYE